MSEYWLISAPGDKTCQQTWETMNNITSKQNNLCENCKFHIPDLKVSMVKGPGGNWILKLPGNSWNF